MLHATMQKVKSNPVRRGATQFPGIAEFALQIQRDRAHVWRVLKAQRQSGRIAAAWREFQKTRSAA